MSRDARKVVFAGAMVLAIGCTTALCQTRDEVLRCRAIPDDPERLACYDALAVSPAPARGKYEPVPLEELSESPLSYRGRLVEVTGQITPGPSGFSLAPQGENRRPIPVELDALPRRERDLIQDGCAGGCEASVQGRVGPVRFVTGIVADSIVVR